MDEKGIKEAMSMMQQAMSKMQSCLGETSEEEPADDAAEEENNEGDTPSDAKPAPEGRKAAIIIALKKKGFGK